MARLSYQVVSDAKPATLVECRTPPDSATTSEVAWCGEAKRKTPGGSLIQPDMGSPPKFMPPLWRCRSWIACASDRRSAGLLMTPVGGD